MPLDVHQGHQTLDISKAAGGAAAVETFESYYDADMGAGVSYTPADGGIFTVSAEQEPDVLEELFSTADGWWLAYKDTNPSTTWNGFPSLIGDGANFRVKNNGGVLRNCRILRHHISTGTYERYSDANLPAGTEYTPADSGLYSWTNNSGFEADFVQRVHTRLGVWERNCLTGFQDEGVTPGVTVSDGVNYQIRNFGGNQTRLVVMRAIMVT